MNMSNHEHVGFNHEHVGCSMIQSFKHDKCGLYMIQTNRDELVNSYSLLITWSCPKMTWGEETKLMERGRHIFSKWLGDGLRLLFKGLQWLAFVFVFSHQGPETRPLFGYFESTTFIVHQEAWWNLWESMGSSMVLSACKKKVVWPINCSHIERLLANLHVSLCNHFLFFLNIS